MACRNPETQRRAQMLPLLSISAVSVEQDWIWTKPVYSQPVSCSLAQLLGEMRYLFALFFFLVDMKLLSYQSCMCISLYQFRFFLSASLYVHTKKICTAWETKVEWRGESSRIYMDPVPDFKTGYIHWWQQTWLKGKQSLTETFICRNLYFN